MNLTKEELIKYDIEEEHKKEIIGIVRDNKG